MNILVYAGIFIFKIIEDALSTLRLIVVSNGKKKFGAILQFIIAIIWVLVTGTVIVDINKDIWKIVFFALGSLVGSYLGSVLEEKIALGTNMLMVEINKNFEEEVVRKIKAKHYSVFKVKSDNADKVIIMIVSPRKKSLNAMDIIREIEPEAVILSEKIKTY